MALNGFTSFCLHSYNVTTIGVRLTIDDFHFVTLSDRSISFILWNTVRYHLISFFLHSNLLMTVPTSFVCFFLKGLKTLFTTCSHSVSFIRLSSCNALHTAFTLNYFFIYRNHTNLRFSVGSYILFRFSVC